MFLIIAGVTIFLSVIFALEDAPQGTTAPTVTQKVQETVWLVTIDAPDFDLMSSEVVRVWKSFEDRTLVTTLNRYQEVKLLGYDSGNQYCLVSDSVNIGYIACVWIKEIPQGAKDKWKITE